MERVGVIVVAAGEGRRMAGTDKIFVPLAGKPLLAHTLGAFQSCPAVEDIVLVLPEDRLNDGRQLVEDHGLSKVKDVCPGGARRQDSVEAGLERLSGYDWVMIHDGARPCVSQSIIEDALEAARDSGAAVPAIPASDTVKVVSEDLFVKKTPPRERLWSVQTPQIFRFDIINEAYSKAQGDVTDDATLVENLGYRVRVFPGSRANIKVTTPDDLPVAESILKEMQLGYR
jgi:2-C-methyl-D-erythritol 4-phosphate cytidylyltransferase